jgi:hypothetical protein
MQVWHVVQTIGDDTVDIQGMTMHSQDVQPGDLFVCVPGKQGDPMPVNPSDRFVLPPTSPNFLCHPVVPPRKERQKLDGAVEKHRGLPSPRLVTAIAVTALLLVCRFYRDS